MLNLSTFRALALALPEATEEAHFAKTSFRVKKQILATYDTEKYLACLKLSLIDQAVFVAMNRFCI